MSEKCEKKELNLITRATVQDSAKFLEIYLAIISGDVIKALPFNCFPSFKVTVISGFACSDTF